MVDLCLCYLYPEHLLQLPGQLPALLLDDIDVVLEVFEPGLPLDKVFLQTRYGGGVLLDLLRRTVVGLT